jgi:hypothetical protein
LSDELDCLGKFDGHKTKRINSKKSFEVNK